MGGCVTDRRQDAGAAAPSGGQGDAAAAERTPALRQRPCPRAGREPAGEAGGETRARPGDVPDLGGRRGSGGGYLRQQLRLLCKICHHDPGLDLAWTGSSFLLGALRPWVKAKDRIADTINLPVGLPSSLFNRRFLCSLASNFSQRESKESEERIGKKLEFELAREV